MNLIGYHGGLLGYDILSKKLFCFRDGIPANSCEVLFNGDHIFIIKNSKIEFLKYTNDEFHTSENPNDSNIEIINYGIYINLQVNDLFLSCRPNLRVINFAKKPLGWENFYIKTNKNSENNEKFHYADTFEHNPKQTKKIEKNIWLYWEENPPQLVEKIFEKIRNLNPEYTVNFITKDNINEFTDYDLFKDHITPTFRSDLLRLILLYNYGGFWIDASTIINSNMNDIIGLNEFNETQFDLIGFYRKAHFIHELPCVESWFMASPRGSFTIKKWLESLLDALFYSPEFVLQKLKEKENFNKIRNTYSDGSLLYFLVYLTQQEIFIENNEHVSIKALCADYSAFYFKDTHGWSNPEKYNSLLYCRDNEIQYIPKLIKLTKGDRSLFHNIGKSKKFNKYSFLGNYLE